LIPDEHYMRAGATMFEEQSAVVLNGMPASSRSPAAARSITRT
jgi:hypothetical protein